MAAFTKPVWREQGPGPLILPPLSGYTKAAGAVEALAPDPVNPNRLFIAAVGGGIWMTRNALYPDPHWIPLTDHKPSLSMSAIAFSPLDPNRNTLFAGYGDTSHASPVVGSTSGPLPGLLKTTNAGGTWTEIGDARFRGVTLTRVLPTAQTSAQGGQIVFVATLGNGLLRSVDGGQSWTQLDLDPREPDGHIGDVVIDPSQPRRVYATNWTGVYRSDDGGTTWAKVSAAFGQLPPYARINLSIAGVSEPDGSHRLFAVVSKDSAYGWALFCTSDHGATWTNLGQPAFKCGEQQAMPKFPIVASPVRSDVVFCADDCGPLWIVTVGAAGAAAGWERIQGGVGVVGSPHTDARNWAFSADPNILFQVNDGGVYRLVNAHAALSSPARAWQEAVGNLRVAEFHSIAYDSVNHVLFGATQDNSIPHQTAADVANWGQNEFDWGDGFCVGVDNAGVPGASVHYSSQQNLAMPMRKTYTSPTHVSDEKEMPLVVDGTNKRLQIPVTPDPTIRWSQDWIINRVDGRRILIGTDFLYESFNRGDTLTSLGLVGTVTAYAYGHVTNPDAIYIGANRELWLRGDKQGSLSRVDAYGGLTPVSISLGRDWRWAYVLDSQGDVHRTRDGGASWTLLTGNLTELTGGPRTIEFLETFTDDEVILVGGDGGVFVCENPGGGKFAFWQKHGPGMPNAIVTGLHYSVEDDVLIAGTLGRSAFKLGRARSTVIGGPQLGLRATGASSCLGGWLEGATVTISAVISDEQHLAPPLTYDWQAKAAGQTFNPVPWVFLVTMPEAGYEVDVTLTVSDNTGFKLHAARSEVTVSPQVMLAREALCVLIHEIETTGIFNWPINPLGSPTPTAVGHVTREMYAEAQALVRRMDNVLSQLLREDGAEVVQAPPPFDAEAARKAWRRLYPPAELALSQKGTDQLRGPGASTEVDPSGLK